MIKKTLFIILLATSSFSFAQEAVSTLVKNTVIKNISEEKADINFTSSEIIKLDNHIEKGEYQELFELLQKTNVSKKNYINYLLIKQHFGHVPLYWLMSDFYAKEGNAQETHKWFYIALIMTQQDSYLCTDPTVKNAPRKLIEFFPESVHVTRNTPQYIDQAMREVIYFISNLKTRIEPNWVCYYGEKPISQSTKLVIDRKKWKSEREKVFNRFADKYQK